MPALTLDLTQSDIPTHWSFLVDTLNKQFQHQNWQAHPKHMNMHCLTTDTNCPEALAGQLGDDVSSKFALNKPSSLYQLNKYKMNNSVKCHNRVYTSKTAITNVPQAEKAVRQLLLTAGVSFVLATLKTPNVITMNVIKNHGYFEYSLLSGYHDSGGKCLAICQCL